mmetsp:Transcript_82343/g.191204  ORF Transcript_82343/g.191204 Transcript_82343/m.191204 type:complete len:315 (-) Transcript_82343:952-1896(-)
MEHSLLCVTRDVLLAPSISVLQKPHLLHPQNIEELQAKVQVVIFPLPGVVDMPLASIGTPAVDLYSFPRQHLHRPVQEVAHRVNGRIQEVHGLLRVEVAKKHSHPWHDDDCIHVQLRSPIVFLVIALLYDQVPSLDEDGRVECMGVPMRPVTNGSPELRLDDRYWNLRCCFLVLEELLRRDVANDQVLVTVEQARMQFPLLCHHGGLIGAGADHGPTEQHRRRATLFVVLLLLLRRQHCHPWLQSALGVELVGIRASQIRCALRTSLPSLPATLLVDANRGVLLPLFVLVSIPLSWKPGDDAHSAVLLRRGGSS